MKLLADENIALVREAFGELGELELAAGRDISPEQLREVGILLLRSVTRVDAALLRDSPCRFVASATSGVDHIDLAALQRRGIDFAHAPGCNAESVVDYVFSALAALSRRKGLDWTGMGFGIIGCGQIGSRLANRLDKLGIELKIFDPLLGARHPLAAFFRDLDEVLEQQVVSIHTPLTHGGRWPTRRMLDAQRLAALKAGAILINAARGDVLDSPALLERLALRGDIHTVIDAWTGEPDIPAELLRRVDIGTPHIAGYSRAGKLNGTRMIMDACLRSQFADRGRSAAQNELFSLPVRELVLPGDFAAMSRVEQLNHCILQAYDVRDDHAALLATLQQPEPAAGFDSLRRNYPERMEFNQFRCPAEGLTESRLRDLRALGFASA